MRTIRLQIPAIAVLWAVVACGDAVGVPPAAGDSIPPVVTALEPAAGARDVPVTAAVTVRFSEPVNPATVGPASFLVRKGFDPVPGTYAFGDSSVSFVPNANLGYLTSFSVTVTRGIRDPAGNQLARDTAWGFQTLSQGTPSAAAR
jgi:Bacterial Ig-like domain